MATEEDKDRFWDLSRLLPTKRPAPRIPSAPAPVLPEIDFSPDMSDRTGEAPPSFGTIPPRSGSDAVKSSFTYTPADNPFLLSVTVERKAADHSFYSHFCHIGQRLLREEGATDTPYVPYFSYIPQYSQLSAEQRAYYFTFRSAVWRREKVRTDFSYLMLLVYEILNLPDDIPPDRGIDTLVYLYTTYRSDYPNLDKYLALWIPDYCLMHALPSPTASLRAILPYVLKAADFKEFYLGCASALTEEGMYEILSLASDYHWQYSRYATEENLPLFRAAMTAALFPVMHRLLAEENLGQAAGESLRRGDVFSGSLSAHNIRCTLTVIYRPFAHTPKFRRILTQAVKYTENKIRAALSVRARLSIADLPNDYRLMIDRAFSEKIRRKETASPPPRPAYETLYDAVGTALSPEAAAEIETASWSTTKILVPEETDAASSSVPLSPMPGLPDNAKEEPITAASSSSPQDMTSDGSPVLSAAELAFLRAVFMRNDALSESIAHTALTTTDTLAENINNAFADFFGDIIMEPSDGGYRIIEDYESEIKTWIETKN